MKVHTMNKLYTTMGAVSANNNALLEFNNLEIIKVKLKIIRNVATCNNSLSKYTLIVVFLERQIIFTIQCFPVDFIKTFPRTLGEICLLQ